MRVTVVVLRAGSEAAPLTFEQPRVLIGRAASADVRLPSRAVSERHVTLFLDPGSLSVLDEGSTNGTRVNGRALVVGRRKTVHAGDTLDVGEFTLRLEAATVFADLPERTGTVARQFVKDAVRAAGAETAPPVLGYTGGDGVRHSVAVTGTQSLIAGRGLHCSIVLDDVDASREHASFIRDSDGVTVRDLGSKNGTQVNNRTVTERRLRDGDEVTVGRTRIEFSDPSDELLRAFEQGPDERLPPPAEPPVPASTSPSPGAVPNTVEPVNTTPNVQPAVATVPARKVRARPPRRIADGILALVAFVILGLSLAALYVLVRGMPTAVR